MFPREIKQFMAIFIVSTIISCSGIISSDTINPQSSSNLDFIYNSIDSLFDQYVTPDWGLVNYDDLWQDPLLQQVVDTIEVFDLSTVTTPEDSFAFWINAYNVLVIYHLKEYGYTPQDQLGFPLFKKKLDCARRKYTLDEIEKAPPAPILQFNDPRSHFVLVCAALSCPPLLNKAYRGKTLYQQIDEKTEQFLNSNSFNPIGSQTPPRVSSLFAFYPNDYNGFERDQSQIKKIKSGGTGKAKEFILSYLTDDTKKNKLKNDTNDPMLVISYDWTINKQ